MKVHHNTLKRAKTFGIELIVEENEIVAIKDGVRLAVGMDGKKVLEEAIAKLGGDKPKLRPRKAVAKRKVAKRRARDEDEDGEGDEEDEEGEEGEGEGKSVIKRKYKMKYKPHRMTCGDALAKQLRTEFMTIKDPDTKKMKIDWKRFTEFAKRNGCWSDSYKTLNKGMRRMNIVNRLRAKVNEGHEITWAV